jgi:hypothetical protein
MRWAGYSDKKSIWLGGLTGFVYMTGIEMLDGYSEGWGFSYGDMMANGIGAFFAISQENFFKQQKIRLKYSYRNSGIAPLRSELLGANFGERILKDYNAQVYWLSVNISSFLKKETRFPSFVNIAFGFGADGMTGGHSNIVLLDNSGNKINLERSRRFLISADIDFSKIKTKSCFLKSIFRVVNILKIPFPSIEYSHSNLKANLLGF